VFAAPAGAVVGSIPEPMPLTINGAVNSIVQSGDRVIARGAFTRIGVATNGFVDLSLADGSPRYEVARPNDAGNVIVSDGAGGWYVGGNFMKFGTFARNRLAHVRADGTVDPAFDPNVNGLSTRLRCRARRCTRAAPARRSTARRRATRSRRSTRRPAPSRASTPASTPGPRPTASRHWLSGGRLYFGGKFAAVNTTAGVGGTPRAFVAAVDAASFGAISDVVQLDDADALEPVSAQA
jgi:hypothetical protein